MNHCNMLLCNGNEVSRKEIPTSWLAHMVHFEVLWGINKVCLPSTFLLR